MKITVHFWQKLAYRQEIEVTDEEYALLKEYEGTDVWENKDSEAYYLLQDNINFSDVFDEENEYTDLLISKNADK